MITNRLALSGIVTAVLLFAPLVANAQAAVSYSANSNTGFTVYNGTCNSGSGGCTDYNSSWGANLKSDALANGGQSNNGSASGMYLEPGSHSYNSSYFTNGYPDNAWYATSGGGSQYSQSTLNRLCYDIDPSYPDPTATGSGTHYDYSSGSSKDNTLLFSGTRWYLLENDSTYNTLLSGNNALHVVKSLTCKSYQLPQNTLSASAYTSSVPGTGITLSWRDTSYHDSLKLGPLGIGTVGIGASHCSFSWSDATTQSNYYSQSYGQYTGSDTVYPGAGTTVYHYTCTNVNGTTDATATITVTAACVSNQGQACNINSCGVQGGTFNCDGSCSGATPPTNNNQACSASSACGTNNGTYNCSNVCSVSAPPVPGNLNQACPSAPNACGQTQSNGTWQCNGSCTSTPPSNASCNQPPATPTLQGLYSADGGTYYGASAPANNPSGYRMYAAATDPNGDNTALYFTWSGISAEWGTPVWVGSGSWSYDTKLANAGPGTYYVNAAAYDNQAWGPTSGWYTITLTAPALPDLISGNVTPTTAAATVPQTYTATISNNGTAAGASTARLRRATDSSGTGSTDIATASVAAIGANGSAPASFTGVALPSGTWYLSACADSTNVVTESVETNNCSPLWTAVVSSYPSIPSGGNSISCSVSPTTGNTSTTYTWTASGASGGNGGPYTYHWGGTALAGMTGNPVTVNNYSAGGPYGGTVYVTDSAGDTSSTVTCGNSVTVSAAPACSTLTASPSTIVAGGQVTLTWSCQNAASCTALPNSDGFSTGATNPASGSTPVTPNESGGQVTYGMTCGGASFNFPAVTILQPQATITANPVRVASGANSTITWSSSNVRSCTESGPGLSTSTQSGNQTISNIAKQSVYTITCQTNSSSASRP